jgi:REP element-mobilizing transposase RayT
MSKRFKKLSHTIYERRYHIVCCPKYMHRIFKDERKDIPDERNCFCCHLWLDRNE